MCNRNEKICKNIKNKKMHQLNCIINENNLQYLSENIYSKKY